MSVKPHFDSKFSLEILDTFEKIGIPYLPYIFNPLSHYPVSILYKSIAGRYRPVRVADGPIMARYRFIMNASCVPNASLQKSIILPVNVRKIAG